MSEKELLIAIVSTILLFLISTVVIVLSVVRYMKKNYQHQQELLTIEMQVQEQTRKNLASDLHDNIGQLLSLTNVTIGSINVQETEKAAQKLEDVKQLVSRSIKELRQLSKIVHGELVLRDGLIAAIEQELNWLERGGYYQLVFVNDTAELITQYPDKDLFLYRLVQEALNNAIKHAHASKLDVVVSYKDHFLTLQVIDNGIGFDSTLTNNSGLGLSNMKKRVSILEGTLDISSSKESGTCITIVIPYANLQSKN